MRRLMLAMSVLAGAPIVGAQVDGLPPLDVLLQRAGEQVERYFRRAQSIVCLEVVHLQPLNASWGFDGFGRTVESELHLSWEPDADGAAPTEAKTVRQVLRVNGRNPRKDDHDDCTTPEQEAQERQPLSLLLPAERANYRFAPAGRGRVDRLDAFMVDYWLMKKASVESSMVEGRETCVSYNIDGGMRGRLWIDAQSYEVLRLEQRLASMVTIPLPKAARRHGGAPSWMMERWDTDVRFKKVSFGSPDETLVLPTSSSSLQVTVGSGTPRLRTMTEYTNYRRFLTAGRVVGE